MKLILSDRMQSIADMVTPGKRVADIGCDHALISIYLAMNGISPGVIAMDIARGPLEAARNNILRYGVSDIVETRLSNGMDALQKGETDTAIISGMGGMLMIDILSKGLHNLGEGYELILSPQSEQAEVRRFLRCNGLHIVDEDMLQEDGKYYNIIRAVFTENATDESCEDTEALYDAFGECLIKKKSPVLAKYTGDQLSKLEGIYCSLSMRSGDNIIARMAEVRADIDRLTRLLDILR